MPKLTELLLRVRSIKVQASGVFMINDKSTKITAD